MKRTTAMVLGGALVVAALLTTAFSPLFRDVIYNHFVVAPGAYSANNNANLSQTNIMEIRDITGTNAWEWNTNQVALSWTNAAVTNVFYNGNATNSQAIATLANRISQRFGTSKWYAVSNAYLVATNANTGKLQTNHFINGILMELRNEPY